MTILAVVFIFLAVWFWVDPVAAVITLVVLLGAMGFGALEVIPMSV